MLSFFICCFCCRRYRNKKGSRRVIAASFFCKSLINRGEDYGSFWGRLMNGYPVIYTLKVLANLYFENFSASKSDKSPKILPYSSIIILPSRQSNLLCAILRNNVFVVDSYCQILSHNWIVFCVFVLTKVQDYFERFGKTYVKKCYFD